MKYILAYSLPIITFLGLKAGGYFSFSGVCYAFVIIPVIEQFTQVSSADNDYQWRQRFFDVLLYGNLFFVYGLLIYSAQWLGSERQPYELVGLVLSLGTVLGSNGINVAHELGHRSHWTDHLSAFLLLLPSHYYHFFIEHNHGHHLDVATPKDPSTARKNQSVYAFYVQSVFGTYVKAWRIQRQLLKRSLKHFLSASNYMLWAGLSHFIWIGAGVALLGLFPMSILALAGIVGLLLLETINYIEHYGLIRQLNDNGRYERVDVIHSWNSNHVLGRMLLYELTRHSDHHYKSHKPYQNLVHQESSPQLPYGYPTSMLLSLIPPLWFGIMNPKIPKKIEG